MNSSDIYKLRTDLELNQIEFGLLFGVHPMTVSKWERGELSPSTYQAALMNAFQTACINKDTSKDVGSIIASKGITAALYLLLNNAHNK